jgi:hypothetical protein
VLGLDGQLGQDEVGLGDQLTVVRRPHLDVGEEAAHQRRGLLAVAVAGLQQLDPRL